MRTLTDVYIKVTKDNVKELMKQINRYDLQPHTYVFFVYDSIKGNEVSLIEPKNRKKVSLSELKRLIDTIPTREEITRLKRQISAYKTNLSLVNERCKELQSDNERLNNIKSTMNHINNSLYDREDMLLKENEKLKHDIKKVRCERDSLNVSFKNFNEMYDNALKKLDIQADLIRDKNAQLEQLKQRKWWQIWK